MMSGMDGLASLWREAGLQVLHSVLVGIHGGQAEEKIK
jgi:hypothetical protein